MREFGSIFVVRKLVRRNLSARDEIFGAKSYDAVTRQIARSPAESKRDRAIFHAGAATRL
jgi:hypothetical protein